MEAVDKLHRLWDTVTDEDRQGLVRSLFDYITYDLDTRRIVDFRLKAWVDRWIALRATLYASESDVEEPKTPETGVQGMYTDVPHRGLRSRKRSKFFWYQSCGVVFPQTTILTQCAA